MPKPAGSARTKATDAKRIEQLVELATWMFAATMSWATLVASIAAYVLYPTTPETIGMLLFLRGAVAVVALIATIVASIGTLCTGSSAVRTFLEAMETEILE